MSGILSLGVRYLLGVLSILATQILAACALAGVGFIGFRVAGRPLSDTRACLLATWLGFAVVLQFLAVWHFFAPITSTPALAVLVIGIGGFLVLRPRLPGAGPAASRRLFIGGAVAFLVFAYWEANLALGPNVAWDSGLYHMQAVQWARSYPIVPGLANLHGPLGFNNLGFLYFAALDHGPWAGRANHLGNGLFTLLLAGYAIAGGVRWTSKERRVSDFFDFTLLPPAVVLTLGGRASDFTTDTGSAAFVLVACALLVRILLDERGDPPSRGGPVITCFLLLATAVTLKSSVAVFAVASALLVVVVAWRRSGRDTLPWSSIGIGVGIAGLIGLIWMAGNLILTGYPLFPVGHFGFPVDWRVPLEHVRAEYANAAFTEREFSWTIGRSWWSSLLRGQPALVLLPAILAILGLGVGWRSWMSARDRISPTGSAASILLVLAMSVLFWMSSIPSPRYAIGIFWGAAGVSWTAAAWSFQASPKAARRLMSVFAILALGPIVLEPVVRNPTEPVRALLRTFLERPGPEGLFQPNPMVPRLQPFTTASGLRLHRSAGQCWDAPLPCTPNPAPNLRLRAEGRLGRGFRVDGDWEMLDFPYPWRPSWLAEWRARQQ